MSTRPHPKVYAAHPLTCYGSVHAEVRLAALCGLLPDVEIVDPEACGWASNADWQAGWPTLSESLSGLVVFAAADETIGAGCLHEIADALALGLPVAAFTDRLGLVELVGTALLPAQDRNPSRAGWLVYGPRLDPTVFTESPRLRVVS
jgi:hypothetical protein